eukprot:scaffold3521_cov195-Alexandrium_tamarense.AAC.24
MKIQQTFASAVVVLMIACLASTSAFSQQVRLNPVVRQSSSVLFAAQDEDSARIEAIAESVDIKSAEVSGEPKIAVKCPDCDLCDGSGRILGGIGTVLEWWPIKAYRPCPNFVDRGGKYERSGQGKFLFGFDLGLFQRCRALTSSHS